MAIADKEDKTKATKLSVKLEVVGANITVIVLFYYVIDFTSRLDEKLNNITKIGNNNSDALEKLNNSFSELKGKVEAIEKMNDKFFNFLLENKSKP